MVQPRHRRRLQKLKARFAAAGIRPQTRRGQNFLLDKNQVNYIARLGELEARDVVLEVGPGTGFLTQSMAPVGCLILGVDVDAKLLAMARAETEGYPNVILKQADILARKNEINPEVLATLQELLAHKGADARLKTVSNLPYSVGTPFVANLFSSPLPWTRAVFLLQYEVARRLVAKPGESDYGSLSIGAALGGQVKLERKVPPQVFWPRPRVDSAVVTIAFRSVAEREAIPWKHLRRLVVAIFNARRKTLRNALKGVAPQSEIAGKIEQAGLDPTRRGATFTPGEMLRLVDVLASDGEEAQ